MSTRCTEANILHETRHFWVSQDKRKGRTVCRVWKISATHSVKVAEYDLGERSVQRAIEDCDRRERELESLRDPLNTHI